MAATEKVGDRIDVKEYSKLKAAACKYYAENGVPDRMEEVLNSMFFTNPDDVNGHVSNYFAKLSKSVTISRVCGTEVLDSKGEPALQVHMYGLVKNNENLLSTTAISNNSRLVDLWKMEDKESEDALRLESITAAISYISDQISEKIKGLDPRNQSELDEIVYSFIDDLCKERDEREARELAESELNAADRAVDTPQPPETKPRTAKSPKGKKSGAPVVIIPDLKAEMMLPGCELVSALSMASCQAAASVTHTQLYTHIRKLRYLKQSEPAEGVTKEEHDLKQLELESRDKVCLPMPVVTILQAGKSCPGKLNCVKEYMITSSPNDTFSQGLKKIRSIQNTVFKTLFVKAGATLRVVSDEGAICPVLDRPEQGLDIIQDAATLLELTAGDDFNIILNLSGKDIFDYEKGKYEAIAGQYKGCDELADFYADICHRHPSVIGIIDPFRPVEESAWMKLCEKISESVYIFGADAWPRPGLLKHKEMSEVFRTSGVVLKYDQMTTITDLMECCQHMRENNNRIMLSTSLGETSDTYLADLAVGLGADYIKVGGLHRGERVCKLNRLLQIEQEVMSQNRLDAWPENTFPKIELPKPPVTPTADGEDLDKDNVSTSDDSRSSFRKK